MTEDLLRIELAQLADRDEVETRFKQDRFGTRVHHLDQRCLYDQLINALGAPRKAGGRGDGGTRNKPGSRPPGWRDDVSELLTDIQTGVALHYARTSVTMPADPKWAIRGLLDIASTGTRQRIADDVHEWVRLARLTLGYQMPSEALPETVCFKRRLTVHGWIELGCGQPTLRVTQDLQSDVWCANPECHDDDKYPNCRDDQGRLTCRRTIRDLRHNFRWTHEEWLALWEDQQRHAQRQHQGAV